MKNDKYQYLSKIDYPEDLRKLNIEDLKQLSEELRSYIIDTVTEIGGHFASNLGVVELTIALHYVFNTPRDKLIWDVGHQTYPHKVLTGRKHKLKTIRKLNGISGFPKREESEYDLYNNGHAGTSISQLLGEAIARDLKKEDYYCIAVIGDASIGCGMAFEAMNHVGHLQTDCLVILNDNDMSISRSVGAINKYLNQIVLSRFYNKSRNMWYQFLYWLPILGPSLKLFSLKFEKAIKDFFMPGSFFEDLGFRYVGPIDGHDMEKLIDVLNKIKEMKGPILLHVITQKGKGYQPAEKNPIEYHSISKIQKLEKPKEKNTISFSDIVGNTLMEIFERNSRAVAITPAMIEGSGLRNLYKKFPERVIDVGIAEQHSLTFAGALSSAGMIPYMCIYSTFLNRGIDQLIQDIALMNVPVRLIIDRAGCVGPDGETHQGLYDLGYLYAIPNIKLYAPATGIELKEILHFVENFNESPIAIRFPKEEEPIDSLNQKIDVSRIEPEIIKSHFFEHFEVGIFTIGITRKIGLELQSELKKYNISSILSAIRWIKPVDIKTLNEICEQVDYFIFIEDSYEYASASIAILNQLEPKNKGKHLRNFAFPTKSIEHGTRKDIFEKYGISVENISQYIRGVLSNKKKEAKII